MVSVPSMDATRGLAMALLCVLAISGCAQKTDWIGGTLVTVDVSGTWRGRAPTVVEGEMEMTLTQRGAKVTGEGRFRATRFTVEGTVRGDVFSFTEPGGRLRGEATVTGEEMTGQGRMQLAVNPAGFRFKLSR
jgi:hypothetical protein